MALSDPARDFILLPEDWGGDFLQLALGRYGSEDVERFVPRVHLHHLADQLRWTFQVAEEGREEEVRIGVEGLEAILIDLTE